MNAAARAIEMIDVLGDLVTLMRRENDMLKQPRTREIEPLVKQKVALVSAYEGHLREVAGQPGFKDELDPPLFERLSAAADEFARVLEENERRLKAVMETTQKVVDAVATAAQKLASTASSYTKGGLETPTNAQNVPIAVDRQI